MSGRFPRRSAGSASRVVVDRWAALKVHAEPLRHAVFVVEQHVPEDLEYDAFDPVSLHAVAFDASDRPVGTGRLLPDGRIGRMAVARPERGRGVGAALLSALVEEARLRGDREVVLAAQAHATPFYQRAGFRAYGEPFVEAGIDHVMMRCPLAPEPPAAA